MYQHRDWQGALLDFPVGKVVCVGLNYAKHVAEMKSQASAEPLLFIKPETALRDVQMKLKAAGQPWEKSKAFDGSAPVSGFIPVNEFPDPQNVTLSLTVNNELRQQGNTREMLTPVIPLISYMSRYFTLRPGDIILTGTPEGVGPLVSGDMLKISVNDHMLTTRII